MQATRLLIGGVLVLGLAATAPAPAQPAPSAGAASPEAASAATPSPAAPAGRVGRISLLSGAVAFGMSGTWRAAAINDPIASGLSVRTVAAGRAELRIGRDTVVLAGGSTLAIARLDASVIELGLTSGRIGLDLDALGPGERVEIDVPRGGIWLEGAGIYDITAGSVTVPTAIAIRKGAARFVGAHADLTIPAGRLALLNGADPIVTTEAPIEPDASPGGASPGGASPGGFLAWWQAREAADAAETAPAHVPPELTGAATLAADGSWDKVDGLGWVWRPRGVAADWAPYRAGSWSWIRPWGWTWIAAAEWGFAPSHYGRWVRIDKEWGWVPGDLGAHPAFAPAVVAFLGTQGVGLSFAEGNGPAIGWFPLAPGEAYWPGYSQDPAYIRRLNAPALRDLAILKMGADGMPPVAVVDGHYANRRFASVVPRPVFAGGHPVEAALLSLPRERLEEAPLIIGAPPIPPPSPPRVAAAKPPRPAELHVSEAHPAKPHPADGHAAAALPRPHPAEGARSASARSEGVRSEAAHTKRPVAVPAVARRIPHGVDRADIGGVRPRVVHDRPARAGGAPLHGPAVVPPVRPRPPHAIRRVKARVPERGKNRPSARRPPAPALSDRAPRPDRVPGPDRAPGHRTLAHHDERGHPRLAAAKDTRR